LKDLKSSRRTSLTRRVVLTGSLGCALTLAIPRHALSCADDANGVSNGAKPSSARGSSELYVFGGSRENTTVIAVTWMNSFGHRSQLRVHAGEQTWALAAPSRSADTVLTDQSGCRIFAGEVIDRVVGSGARVQAVVIEAPTRMISSGSAAQVWAERIASDGSRIRTGSAFLGRLAADHATVANLYHRSSPADDSEELTQLVAEAISVDAQKSGYTGDPRLYGRRVASAITPDVLRFDPRSPVGFTFAAQNGRHPHDAAQSVVNTVLRGTIAPSVSQPTMALQERFPYFLAASDRT
jgi:hypothetical protein